MFAYLHGLGEPIPRPRLLAEVGIFWGAGFETTAHTICWTLFLLATHPEVETKLLQELEGLGLAASPSNPKPRAMIWEDLSNLKYLSAVINESMRMYPVVSSGTIRITHDWTKLGEYTVPPGIPILTPFYAIHRSPRLWVEPDRFMPGRWLEGGAAGKAAAAAGGGGGVVAIAGGGDQDSSSSSRESGKGKRSRRSSSSSSSDGGYDVQQERDQEEPPSEWENTKVSPLMGEAHASSINPKARPATPNKTRAQVGLPSTQTWDGSSDLALRGPLQFWRNSFLLGSSCALSIYPMICHGICRML